MDQGERAGGMERILRIFRRTLQHIIILLDKSVGGGRTPRFNIIHIYLHVHDMIILYNIILIPPQLRLCSRAADSSRRCDLLCFNNDPT